MLMDSSITLRKETLQKYMNPCFVETGTFKGGGVKLALDCGFSRIISIEIDPILYAEVAKEYESNERVVIHHGDSTQVLLSILSYINTPITFWLDAHIQESAVVGAYPVPLIQELNIIGQIRRGSHDTVMIDDRRLFGVGNYWNNIRERDIIQLLQEAYPDNQIMTEDSNAGENDILVSWYVPTSLEQLQMDRVQRALQRP
ncbi:MAG: hypothetical protein WC479_04500 [Candidatus Izemoplasmatales bacterium]|jgi:hypothetical protein